MGSHDSRLTTSHPPYVSPDARGCPSAVRHSDSSTVPQPASLTQLSLRHGLALARFWCPTDLNVIDSDRRFVEGYALQSDILVRVFSDSVESIPARPQVRGWLLCALVNGPDGPGCPSPKPGTYPRKLCQEQISCDLLMSKIACTLITNMSSLGVSCLHKGTKQRSKALKKLCELLNEDPEA